mmetsp:Transcript_14343/g.13864  ORF Transcript_14343/g.13864 Transcript_14343/m.13864 type:complete len:133 (+) Transcript_14343:86-484(+)
MKDPKMINIQSKAFSKKLRLGPNSFKWAAAGKIQLTVIVQTSPTKEQMKLNDGTYMATSSDRTIKTNLISEETISIIRSDGMQGATISSIPSAKGNIDRVYLENEAKMMSHVSMDVLAPAAPRSAFSKDMVT